MLPVSLDCHLLIAPAVFSNVYLQVFQNRKPNGINRIAREGLRYAESSSDYAKCLEDVEYQESKRKQTKQPEPNDDREDIKN
jgi:hypothetical protein